MTILWIIGALAILYGLGATYCYITDPDWWASWP
jgi:hypothetical protein